MLDQQAGMLADVEGEMVREVLGQLQTDFQVDGKDITPDRSCWSGSGFAASTCPRGSGNSPVASGGGCS